MYLCSDIETTVENILHIGIKFFSHYFRKIVFI